jgi:hypothetical protein
MFDLMWKSIEWFGAVSTPLKYIKVCLEESGSQKKVCER